MANRDELLDWMQRKKFFERNGEILRSINLIHGKYIRLKDVRLLYEDDMTEREFLDAVNYLSLSGYIDTRIIDGRKPAAISDVDYTRLEANLTQKGIDLICGVIDSPAVKLPPMG